MNDLQPLLDKLHEIKVEQAVTNTKLDALSTRIEAHAISDEKKFADHETRIRASEKKHWYSGGVAAVLAVIGTVITRKYVG